MTIKIILLLIVKLLNSKDWDFVDFEKWKKLYPECGLSRQSPIDIPSNLQQNCDINDDLQLKWDIKKRLNTFIVENKGYSLKATSGYFQNSTIIYNNLNSNTIGNLTNTYYGRYGEDAYYCLDSLHFHWGGNNSFGPEHTLNGETGGVLELHFVHYSCQYKNIGEALNAYINNKTGKNNRILAVVGVLFDIGNANEAIDRMITDEIIYNDTINKMEVTFDITDLIPFEHNFIGYYGSLTTPPCYETVFWHVLTQKMTISEQQLNKFRNIIDNNWRPIQPLNNRPLYICSSDLNLNPTTTNDGSNDITTTDNKNGLTELEIGYFIGMLVFAVIVVILAIYIIIIKYCNNSERDANKDINGESQQMAEERPIQATTPV